MVADGDVFVIVCCDKQYNTYTTPAETANVVRDCRDVEYNNVKLVICRENVWPLSRHTT